MTATTMPSSTPSSMASTVMINVVRTPRITGGRNMLSNMNPHWNTGFVSSMCTNMRASTAMTAAATRRPGCRCGTARICWGGAGRVVLSSVMASADRRVHRRVVDGTGLDAPLREHLLVGAVLDERRQGLLDGVGELGLVLGDDVPVGRGVVDLAEQLELALGLAHRIGLDRGVGEPGDVLARDHGGGRLVLAVVLVDRDGVLARRGALLRPGGQVVDLHGGLLDGDLQTARVLDVDLL